MRAGKNVLCEKPVMMNSKDLEDVLAVAKETGKVFYPRRTAAGDKDYLTIKKLYDEKTLGNVFHIESRYHGSRGIPGDWRGHQGKGRRHDVRLGRAPAGPAGADGPRRRSRQSTPR